MGSPRTNHIAILIVLASLSATAFFLAQGTTGLLAAAFLPVEPGGAAPVGATRAVAARESRDDTAILRRNIFDHEQGAIDQEVVVAVETPEGPATPSGEVDWTNPPVCDGSIRLVAAVVNPVAPDWSFAAIVGAAGKAMLYRRGQSVDGREVYHIESSRVLMRPATGGCQITMFGEEPAVGRPRAAPQVAAAEEAPAPNAGTSEGGISATDMESGITRVSDTNFTIDRSLVDRVLENQAELMRTARVIPHEENGRTVGVKLYGIRRNSLLGRLGVQNGDMLRTINGYDMSSPDSALEAYARLRTADHLTLSVVRRGQPTTIDYNIR
ncbi:MAG: general secretion pathway protein GspC [Sandaracinus sp.]|nr:general secretion pathway protein GspC [Sandaracinus sp.]MCB9621318.1 general secretion pathway protein GspC [Sandaracinus sp.]MCB9633303.1 general secretion pathway protein GspC [Sandaracinus sp.]